MTNAVIAKATAAAIDNNIFLIFFILQIHRLDLAI